MTGLYDGRMVAFEVGGFVFDTGAVVLFVVLFVVLAIVTVIFILVSNDWIE